MVGARANEDPEVVIVLLNAGANGKLKSSDDMTAFDYGAGNDKLKGANALKALQAAAGK